MTLSSCTSNRKMYTLRMDNNTAAIVYRNTQISLATARQCSTGDLAYDIQKQRMRLTIWTNNSKRASAYVRDAVLAGTESVGW